MPASQSSDDGERHFISPTTCAPHVFRLGVATAKDIADVLCLLGETRTNAITRLCDASLKNAGKQGVGYINLQTHPHAFHSAGVFHAIRPGKRQASKWSQYFDPRLYPLLNFSWKAVSGIEHKNFFGPKAYIKVVKASAKLAGFHSEMITKYAVPNRRVIESVTEDASISEDQHPKIFKLVLESVEVPAFDKDADPYAAAVMRYTSAGGEKRICAAVVYQHWKPRSEKAWITAMLEEIERLHVFAAAEKRTLELCCPRFERIWRKHMPSAAR